MKNRVHLKKERNRIKVCIQKRTSSKTDENGNNETSRRNKGKEGIQIGTNRSSSSSSVLPKGVDDQVVPLLPISRLL